jgi:hypothetical protein
MRKWRDIDIKQRNCQVKDKKWGTHLQVKSSDDEVSVTFSTLRITAELYDKQKMLQSVRKYSSYHYIIKKSLIGWHSKTPKKDKASNLDYKKK